jgi:hypothetical protein
MQKSLALLGIPSVHRLAHPTMCNTYECAVITHIWVSFDITIGPSPAC